jgi:hypothetical protein
MHMKKVLAVLAVAGLASSAMAQSFDGRVAWGITHDTNNVPAIENGGVYEFDASGLTTPVTLNFSMLFGAFDAQGFTMRGVFNWNGDLVGTGTGFTVAPHPTFSTAVRGPYNFNPVGAGQSNGTSITGIDLARNPVVNVPWNFGDPEPTEQPILNQANNQYFQVYRFVVTLTDLSERDIVFSTVNGAMQTVAGFTHLGSSEPDEETPGQVTWVMTSFVTDSDANGSFTLRIVPAPGAAALLGLGGLVAARRRR